MNRNSLIYDQYIKANRIDDSIKNLDIDRYLIPLSKLTYTLDTVKRKFKYSITNKLVDAVLSGDVILVDIPTNLKVPSLFPTWLNKTPSGQVRAVVNASPYSGIKFDGDNFTGNITLLFSILQAGLLLREIELNRNIYENSAKIVSLSLNVYTSLFSKVLDRLHSIRLSFQDMFRIEAEIRIFFLATIIGRELNSRTIELAISPIKEQLPKGLVLDTEHKDLKGFLEYLSQNIPTLHKLDYRAFLNTWISMYSSNTILSLELYPYFIATMVGYAVVGSPVVKSYYIERIGNYSDVIDLYNTIVHKI